MKKTKPVITYCRKTETVRLSLTDFLDLVQRTPIMKSEHVWVVFDWAIDRIVGVYSNHTDAQKRRERVEASIDKSMRWMDGTCAVLKFRVKG